METVQETVVPLAKLVYIPVTDPASLPVITQAKDVYELAMKLWDKETIYLQQEFKVMLLNGSSHVLNIVPLFNGGIMETPIEQRLIFITALAGMAVRIILVMNRTNGSLKPSNQDRKFIARVSESGKILGITLLDFVLISPEGYYSFAENEVI